MNQYRKVKNGYPINVGIENTKTLYWTSEIALRRIIYEKLFMLQHL